MTRPRQERSGAAEKEDCKFIIVSSPLKYEAILDRRELSLG
ncbi:MAG: hypothetical protein AB7K04_05400 [Pseudorhodoplanes sp.]